jgi:hypothetical protein
MERSGLVVRSRLRPHTAPATRRSVPAVLTGLAALIALVLLALTAVARAGLPDGRGYELVSPPDAGGVPVSAARAYLDDPKAARRVLLESHFPIASLGGGDSLTNDYRSARAGNGSWTQAFVGPPPSVTANQNSAHYGAVLGASRDLTRLFFQSPLFPALGSIDESLPIWALQPDDSFAWTSQGAHRDTGYGGPISLRFVGNSADGNHVFFYSTVSLELDAAPSGHPTLYDRVGAATYAISKDPNEAAFITGTLFDGTPLLGSPTFMGASDDGRVAAFTVTPDPADALGSIDQLYVRLNDLQTVEASAPRTVDGNPCLNGVPTTCVHFLAVTPDGSKVFFSTSQQLTADDTDHSLDIYEFDASTGMLSRVSTGSPGTGNGDSCSTTIGSGCDSLPLVANDGRISVSRDGSRVYFASPEILDPNHGVLGAANVYVHANGVTRFVTTLAPGDYGPERTELMLPVDFLLSPDGSKMLLSSTQDRTTFAADGHREIYEYTAAGGSGPVCVSCNPHGPALGDASLLGSAIESSGRVFFQSSDGLAAGDTNGRQDVYEYVPPGLGVPSGLFLISSGQSKQDSSLAFVSSDPSGRDVIFDTSDTLVSQDLNGTVGKVYDARIGGGAPSTGGSSCLGPDCRGPRQSPPAGLGGGSESVFGVGSIPTTTVSKPVVFRLGAVSAGARVEAARSGVLVVSASGRQGVGDGPGPAGCGRVGIAFVWSAGSGTVAICALSESAQCAGSAWGLGRAC